MILNFQTLTLGPRTARPSDASPPHRMIVPTQTSSMVLPPIDGCFDLSRPPGRPRPVWDWSCQSGIAWTPKLSMESRWCDDQRPVPRPGTLQKPAVVLVTGPMPFARFHGGLGAGCMEVDSQVSVASDRLASGARCGGSWRVKEANLKQSTSSNKPTWNPKQPERN